MLDSLISSKTRIKLLIKFFINSQNSSWLRNLETEFGESSNSIRLELNRLEKAGLLTTNSQGNKKLFQANTKHPMFKELHSIVLKQIGIDKIISNVAEKLGEVEKVFLCGELAKGRDSKIIDLIIIGDVNKSYLQNLSEKAEKLVHRNIRTLVLEDEKSLASFTNFKEEDLLLIWSNKKI